MRPGGVLVVGGVGFQRAVEDADQAVGILHGSLKTHTAYDENTAWAHILNAAA